MSQPWRRRRFSIFWAGLLVTASALAGERSVIPADHLIDGLSPSLRNQVTVLIEDDRIAAIGGPELARGSDNVIDLGSSTLLPGLIDVHAHPLIDLSLLETVTFAKKGGMVIKEPLE